MAHTHEGGANGHDSRPARDLPETAQWVERANRPAELRTTQADFENTPQAPAAPPQRRLP